MTTIQEHAETYDGKWVGDDRFPVRLGDVGFLLELTSYVGPSMRRRVELRQHPAKEAGTFEEVLYGIIQGARTDVEALGVAEVTEVTPNGRGRVKTIWGDDAKDALAKLGYPDLAEQLDDARQPWTK
jgi:hypothetical protein